MMARDSDTTRVLIALTESSPVRELWEAAIAQQVQTGADLLALFLAEDHWHRAATLPFTREISRLSGVDVDFTLQRARQIQEESIERTKRLVDKLAADAKLSLAFEVLVESDRKKIREMVSGTRDILIAPSFITGRPLFAEFRKLDCRVQLVDVPRIATSDEAAERESG